MGSLPLYRHAAVAVGDTVSDPFKDYPATSTLVLSPPFTT